MVDWLTESFWRWLVGPMSDWRGIAFAIILFSVIGAVGAVGDWWKRWRA